MNDPDELSPDERGRILRLIRETVQPPQYGRVTQVFEHSTESDWSNHEANVVIPPGSDTHEPRRMPVATPGSDEIRVPREGDLVLVEYINGDRPIVTKAVAADEDRDRALLGAAGDVRAKRGSLYTELAGDGTYARIAKKAGDLDEPTARVELDETGAITIRTEQDQNIAVEHAGKGDIVTDHAGTGDVAIRVSGDGELSIANTSPGGVSIENSNLGDITVSNSASGNTTVEATDGSVDVSAPTGDAQVDGSTVTLGGGGNGVITDVTVSTTKDGDGDVQSVTLDITRSSVVSTE